MPPRGLPGNANLEQLRNGAKSFLKAIRAGDAGAADVAREFHPRYDALVEFRLADAQLVIARSYGFASWPKLKAWLELSAAYSRSPHHEPERPDRLDEFLRLACLNYGDDDPARWRRASEMLDAEPELGRANLCAAAAAGDLEAARALIDADPSAVNREGGPHRWPPLLYLTYSRVERGDHLAVARLLLDHGADPNAGYLWEGLCPPFTALTGAFGNGEGDPPPHEAPAALARLLLEAGADPNDGQTLYNCQWARDSYWLELLFEFGLGGGAVGPWRRRLEGHHDSPKQMLEDVLMSACGQGHIDRVRLLLAHGVDPAGRERHHRIYAGRSPAQEAAINGQPAIVELLVEAGAPDVSLLYHFIAAACSGDREAGGRLLLSDPSLREQAIAEYPDEVARAAEREHVDGVALLIELGWDVNAFTHVPALHEAAQRGNLPLIRLLLEHRADPELRDHWYQATAAGWAEHHGQAEAERLLRGLER
jgi:ankyrin repeat protein